MANRKRGRVLRLETPEPAGRAGQGRSNQGVALCGRAARGADKVSHKATIGEVALSWC